MIDFALMPAKRTKQAEEAIFQPCIIRFRPIMMTTMAALMGTLPIALGWGAVHFETRVRTCSGRCLAVSQVLTLYLTRLFTFFEPTSEAHESGCNGEAEG